MQEEQGHKHHEEGGIFDGAMHAAMELGLSSITGRRAERKSRGAVPMVAKAAAPQILGCSVLSPLGIVVPGIFVNTKAAWCPGGPGGMGPFCQVLLSAGWLCIALVQHVGRCVC